MNNSDISKQLNQRIGIKINFSHFAAIGSTNQYAKQLSQTQVLQNPCVIWADQQTAGVGKFERAFYSPAGGGLYVTLLLPQFKIESQQVGLFTTSLAMAIVQAIKDCFDITVDVKWVNDIYHHERKIAGILVEQGTHHSIIVGVGINLFQQTFPPEISTIAGNLLTSAPSLADRQRFFIVLIDYLYNASLTYTNAKFLSDYKRRLTLMNRRIQVQLGRSLITGKAVNINDLGQLIILDDATSERRVIPAGEVTKIFS